MSYFNEAITRLIKEKGITQKKLAELLQTDPATVNNWVKGRKTPNMESIKNICEVLEVSFSYFIEDYEERNIGTSVSDDLVLQLAIDRYLQTFGYRLALDSKDNTFCIVDIKDNNKVLRKFKNEYELSIILNEINQNINNSLFYTHNKNYLIKHDISSSVPEVDSSVLLINDNYSK